jgi:cytochrome P450
MILPSPPQPQRELPLLGFLRAVRTNALTMWTDAAYQQDVVAHRFLNRTNILLNDPDAIRHVLVDNWQNYRRSPASIRILRPITGQGLLLSEGDHWRLQRRTVAPALAPRTLPLLARHIVTCTDEAIPTLDAECNLLAAMQNLTLDIAGRSMFSLETRRFGPAMRAHLVEFGMKYARPHLFDMLLPAAVPTLRDLRRRAFQKRWMALIQQIMDARLAVPASDTPRDLFDLLLAARDPETGAAFSREQLRDQVATLILAGHETTAVALFWSLVLLAMAPDEQACAAEEARTVDITPDNAIDMLPRLVRTRAVIDETLRLYPPAFIIVREAIRADRAGTIDIPRGAVVMIAPWVLGRHRRHWRDPDAFDPSRFLPDAPPPSRFAYMPFGAGPRICVGAQFALAEATLVLAKLMRAAHISLLEPPPTPVAIVTTQPDHPPLFRLTARK